MSEQPKPAPSGLGPVVTVKPTVGMQPTAKAARDAQRAAIISEATKAPTDAPVEAAPSTALTSAPAGAKAPVAAPVDAPKDDSFQKLLREKAALRQEAESLNPYREVSRVVDPNSLKAIAKAIQEKNPLAMLAAAGMTNSDYIAAMAGVQTPGKEKPLPAEEEVPKSNPEVEALRKELNEIKAEREQRRIEEGRRALTEKLKSELTKEKFKLINHFGRFDQVVQGLESVYTKGGGLPAETLEESAALVAGVLEENLAKDRSHWESFLESEGWSKPLTPGQASNTVTHDAPGSASSGKTLTNSLSAPRPVTPAATSRAELLKQLERDEALWAKVYPQD